MLLEKQYGDPHRKYGTYRKEIKNWPPIKYGDANSRRDFFAFKCKSLGVATKWNAMETTGTLRMLVSKLPNSITDTWNRNDAVKKSTKGAIIKQFYGIL